MEFLNKMKEIEYIVLRTFIPCVDLFALKSELLFPRRRISFSKGYNHFFLVYEGKEALYARRIYSQNDFKKTFQMTDARNEKI